MEELIDFLIDVFGNVWRKFKINPVTVALGGALSAALIMPYMYQKYPIDDYRYALARAAAAALLFIFMKAYALTIKEVKINFRAVRLIFKNLLNLFIFVLVMACVFGALSFTAAIPFTFPAFSEKFTAAAIAAAIVSGIIALALLPNALVSLIFSCEGRSFKEAVSEAGKIISMGRGKMYALTISLLLCVLVLNLTYAGTIIIFPLIILSMGQARESLAKIKGEKQNKCCRQKPGYAKDSRVSAYEQNACAKAEPLINLQNCAAAVKDIKAASGLGDVFKAHACADNACAALAKKEAPALSSKAVSKAEYGAMHAQKREEEISLYEVTDFSRDKEIERDITVEFEAGGNGGLKYKSGKQYLEEFGNIKRKPAHKGNNPAQDKKREENARNYIENFGIIKKK
jgi:hypothetical protein